jgi:hypothetical protein
VNEALARHPEIDASEIEVRVASGEVTLTGTAEDRHAKRLAEDIAEGISGVVDVRNEIKVHRGLLDRLFGSSDDDESRRSAADRDVTPSAARETRPSGSTGSTASGTTGGATVTRGRSSGTSASSGTTGTGGTESNR